MLKLEKPFCFSVGGADPILSWRGVGPDSRSARNKIRQRNNNVADRVAIYKRCSFANISTISAGVTTMGVFGKCLVLPVTK